jgi:hypothetical protein
MVKSIAMKKIILPIYLSILLFSSAYAQNPNKDYYLEKSHNQRTTGWVLTGIGGAMIIGGSIAFGQNFEVFGPGGESEAIVIAAGGIIAGVGVIQLVKASKNKIRAGVSFNNYLNPIIDFDKIGLTKSAMVNATFCINLQRTKKTKLMSY